MGDVMTLVERAQEHYDEKQAAKMAEKLRKNSFTLEDMLDQMEQVRKMGPMGQIMEMIPGMGGMAKQAQESVDRGDLKRVEAIIRSMTPAERREPVILNAARRRRIAQGSGTRLQDVNQLVKQFGELQKVMKQMSGGRLGRRMPGMFGRGGARNGSEQGRVERGLGCQPAQYGQPQYGTPPAGRRIRSRLTASRPTASRSTRSRRIRSRWQPQYSPMGRGRLCPSVRVSSTRSLAAAALGYRRGHRPVRRVSGTAGRRFVLSGGAGAKSLTASVAPKDTIAFLEVRTDLPGDQHAKLADFMSHFPGFKDRAQFDTALDELLNRLTSAVSPDLTYTSAFKPWMEGEVDRDRDGECPVRRFFGSRFHSLACGRCRGFRRAGSPGPGPTYTPPGVVAIVASRTAPRPRPGSLRSSAVRA
jgi:hypothetical protein